MPCYELTEDYIIYMNLFLVISAGKIIHNSLEEVFPP